jgi:hypothetical protein
MTEISELLAKGAEELRRFQRTPDAAPFDTAWLSRLADRLAAAGSLAPDKVERQIHAIAHSFIDSGPMDEQAAPSFWLVVDALQRRSRRS